MFLFGNVPSTFAMDQVDCGGQECSLLDCSYNRSDDCKASEGAGVICS